MIKGWKKITALAVAIITVLSMNMTTFAAETITSEYTSTIEQQETESTNTFDMIPYSIDGTALKRDSWRGSTGTSRLSYMSSNRSFTWGATLDNTSTFVFEGTISIYTQSTGKYRGEINIYGGTVTGSVSGMANIPFSLTKGVMYTAKYSGVATSAWGQMSVVNPGAKIAFRYN